MLLEALLRRVSLVADVAHKLALFGWLATRTTAANLLSFLCAMHTRSVTPQARDGRELLTTSFAHNFMLVTVHTVSELRVVN